MIKYDFEQRSQAWHEIRAGRITGTRFKTLMSKDSTEGYKSLITELATEIIIGKQEETYTNDIMQRGIDLEPVAIQEYNNFFGLDVESVGFITPKNKYEDWIGVSPDGLVNGGMVEIKCPLAKTHFNYINRNELPAAYRYQVQGQLFVSGLAYCDFVSYYPNMKLFVFRVLPDKELFETFEKELDKLIPLVLNKVETYNKYSIL